MDLKDGWIKKFDFKGLEDSCFHNPFALTKPVFFMIYWIKTGANLGKLLSLCMHRDENDPAF